MLVDEKRVEGEELSVGKEERAEGHRTIVSFWYTILAAPSYNSLLNSVHSLVHAAVTLVTRCCHTQKIIVAFPRQSSMSPKGKCCSVWGM